MMRRSSALSGALVAALWMAGLAGAASYGAAQESTPIVVLAEGCPMTEVDLQRVASFAGTPTGGHTDAIAATPAVTVPGGDVPDDETVEAVTELVYLWIGCRNTNDTLYQFAVYTDAFLRDLVERYGPIPPELAVLEGRVLNPLPEGLQASLGEIERMVALDDGRVAVELVVIDPLSVGVTGVIPDLPEEEMQVDVLLVVRLVDGRWLVDGLQYGDEPYVGVPLTME
jgi:hypothetical protein